MLLCMKAVKGVNPESSHHKGKKPLFCCGGELYEVMDVD